MKPFIFKMAIAGLAFGAAMLFAPSCRAQSEIAPDHFDGTDSWEVAAKAPVPHALHAGAPKNQLVKSVTAGAPSAFQLAAARQPSAAQRHGTVAIIDKRKLAARKPEKQ